MFIFVASTRHEMRVDAVGSGATQRIVQSYFYCRRRRQWLTGGQCRTARRQVVALQLHTGIDLSTYRRKW